MDQSAAVVLLGINNKTRGIGRPCQLCHFEDCAACAAADGICVFNALDLGVALGSAVALVADNRIDTRIMFTIGQAAASLALLGEHKLIMGIPLSVSGEIAFL